MNYVSSLIRLFNFTALELATMQSFQLLIQHLQDLKAAGPTGFEGLVAQLLERLTDQRFFLAQAGSQEGRDMSTAGFTGTSIAVEAKRFQTSKSLKRRELLGELLELPEWVDLWVIATTARVSDQLASVLRLKATERGVAVEFLEAPSTRLGDLVVLCASHGDIVKTFFGESIGNKIQNMLEGIRNHPDFSANLRNLKDRFSASSIGYAQARTASHDHLISAFRDRAKSRVLLSQPVNVMEDEGRHVVERSQVLDRLNSWWQNPSGSSGLCVLLGEEGMGKTWAMAAWLASHLKASNDLPLTIFLPAQEAYTTQLPDLISAKLLSLTRVRDGHFWANKTIAFAARRAELSPTILLVLDGINEHHHFDWPALFDALAAEPWADQVATIVTCRTNYWNENFASYSIKSPWIVEVGPYDDKELRSAAEKSKLDVASLPSTLTPLLRRPRYFGLTVKHRVSLEESGDVTIDRLIYEDWKDRITYKRKLISDTDFRCIISDAAKNYRDTLSKRDIQNILPLGDNLSFNLDELITGGVFVQDSFGRRKIDPIRLEQGLGLLLADAVVRVVHTGENAMKEAMAGLLEPQADMDRKVAICRSAATFAVLEPGFPAPARFALLRQWIESRNLALIDHESFLAYLPAALTSYIQLVEHCWKRQELNQHLQRLIVLAFFHWRDNRQVEAAVAKACEKWLSFVHPYGFSFIGGRQHKERESVFRQEIEQRLGRSIKDGQTLHIVDELEVTENDDFLWLSYPGLLLASLFRPESFLPAMRGWALSRSVMGFPEERASVGWILRQSKHDLWPLLEATISPLLSGSQIMRRAAWELLWASGLEEAGPHLEQLSRDLFPLEEGQTAGPADPCLRFWPREDCALCAKRLDVPDRLIALRLAPHALDPGLDVGIDIRERLQRALAVIQRDQLFSGRMMTSDHHYFESIESTLAALAPELLAKTYRDLLDDLPGRTKEERQTLLGILDELSLIASTNQYITLEALWSEFCSFTEWTEEDMHAEAIIFASLLWHLNAEEQLHLLLQRPPWAFNERTLIHWFKRLPENIVETIGESLLTCHSQEVERKLLFLWMQSAGSLVKAVGPEKFVTLLSDPNLASFAIEYVVRVRTTEVLDLSVRGGLLTPSWTQSISRGRIILPERSELPYETLARSIDLGSLSHLIQHRPADLSLYASDLNQAFQSVHSQSDRLKANFSKQTIADIWRTHREIVVSWLIILEDERRAAKLVRPCHMLLEPLAEALLELEPLAGLRLFRTLLRHRREAYTVDYATGVDVLAFILFSIPRNQYSDELLREWLDSCRTDKDLFELSLASLASKADGRLLDLVRERLTSPKPLERAAAIMLSGFVGHQPKSIAFLDSFKLHELGWLCKVRAHARQHLSRDGWAQEWLRRFALSPNTDEAFANFRLFLCCTDRRYHVWGSDILQDTKLSGERLLYATVQQDRIRRAIQENEKAREKTFAGQEVAEGKVYPWLRSYLG